MKVRHVHSCLVVLGITLMALSIPGLAAQGADKDTPKTKRVGPGVSTPLRGTTWYTVHGAPQPGTVRKEVFAFTRKPTVEKMAPDRYRISFACKDSCDVTIAVVDARGKIVRHLASGVLGTNAPAPFQKDSLSQELFWDGKDDQKRYVDPPEQFRVRVSLGLKPTFGRILGWHPKDNTGYIFGIAADPTGVFVVETGARPHIVKYDHDTNYLGTILPPPATLSAEQLQGYVFVQLADGKKVLWGKGRAGHYGNLIPEVKLADVSKGIAIARGKIALMTSGYQSYNPIVTLRTDGRTLDGVLVGERLSRFSSEFDGPQKIAASPDGKWLYLSAMNSSKGQAGDGLRLGKWEGHVVFRIPWDYQEPLPKHAFWGDLRRPGDHPELLNDPNGIACDAQGNLYIADRRNNRIQVISPDRELIKSIPADDPLLVAIHQKTGEIYYYTARKAHYWQPAPRIITKLGPLADPKEVARFQVPYAKINQGELIPPYSHEGFPPSNSVLCVDSWAEPTTVWVTEGKGRIKVLADLGDHFAVLHDFFEEVKQDGFIPHVFGSDKMCQVYADPLREKVYYFHKGCFGFKHLARFDPETGNCEIVDVKGDDIAFGPDGLMYVRRVGYIIRLDPETLNEVYFDYGEPIPPSKTGGREITGAIRLEDQTGPKTFQDGIGVGVDGTICVLSNIWSYTESWGADYDKRPWKYTGDAHVRPGYLLEYTLRRFPGRWTASNATVWLFNHRGELLREDHIPGLTIGACGIRRDKDGNLYLGYNHHKVVEGRAFIDGSLVKFPPTGGKILSTRATNPPLKELPNRPPDFSLRLAGRPVAPDTPDDKLKEQWAEGMLWSYGGMGDFSIPEGAETCTCPNNRFDLDYFARSFIPECYRQSVAVVDAGGNLILHIGQYGNEDSRGPGTMPVGGDGIAFAWPWYVSVTDRYLYVSDSVNDRIVVVKLDYHRNVEVPVPGGSAR